MTDTNTQESAYTEPRYMLYCVRTGDTLRTHRDAALLATWAQRALGEPWGLIDTRHEDVKPQQSE
jgi:hypothetical protein